MTFGHVAYSNGLGARNWRAADAGVQQDEMEMPVAALLFMCANFHLPTQKKCNTSTCTCLWRETAYTSWIAWSVRTTETFLPPRPRAVQTTRSSELSVILSARLWSVDFIYYCANTMHKGTTCRNSHSCIIVYATAALSFDNTNARATSPHIKTVSTSPTTKSRAAADRMDDKSYVRHCLQRKHITPVPNVRGVRHR